MAGTNKEGTRSPLSPLVQLLGLAAVEHLSSDAVGIPARPSPGPLLHEDSAVRLLAGLRPCFHDLDSLKTLSLRPPPGCSRLHPHGLR